MPLLCRQCEASALIGVPGGLNPSGLSCQVCGWQVPAEIKPLFVITGASGVGKSTVVPYLRQKLMNTVVMDSDLLWNRCGKGHYVNNWLRIAYSLAQTGLHTVICGTLLPGDFAACEDRSLVGQIYFLNLHCEDEDRERRLKARPAERGHTDKVVSDQKTFADWFLKSAETSFSPPLVLFNTSRFSAEQVSVQLADWIRPHLAGAAVKSGAPGS